MTTKLAASQDASDHIHRARVALDSAHRDGLNANGVLRNPHVQASHLKVAREEISKALASSSGRGGDRSQCVPEREFHR